MRLTPKSEKEVARENLIPVAVYGFQIAEASEEISKAGNEMIKLNVQVFLPNGSHRFLFDYLLESVSYKLRHIAEVCGLLDDYEAGTLDAISLVGKTGHCKVGIKKDTDGNYPDSNRISDYVFSTSDKAVTSAPRSKGPTAAGAGIVDDEIPF